MMFQKKVLFLFWVTLLALIFYIADQWLSIRNNPNQKPEVQHNAFGQKSVILYPNDVHAYLADGFINGYPVTFLIDTGASFVSIPGELAQKIGLKKGAIYRVSTANGITKAYATTVHSLIVAGIEIRGKIIASINPANQGDEVLLGMSALKYLHFTIQNGNLILYPPLSESAVKHRPSGR